jgi:hypothetical protein
MKNNIKKLTLGQIRFLKKKYESVTFNSDFHLVYETQIPNTGIVLLNGEINLIRKKKSQTLAIPGIMLGVYELLNNIPVGHGCKVMENSELIMLQKSDILEALNDEESKLYEIIKENVS